MKLKKILTIIATGSLFILNSTISTAAATIDKGIFTVTDSSFTVPMMTDYTLGSDDGQPGSEVMDIPGGGPIDGDFKTALEQNGELWYSVEEVKVKFTLTTASNPDEADFDGFFVQGVFQLGDTSGWAWADNDGKPDLVSIEPSIGESGFQFGEEYTLTYHPRAFMDASGTDENSQGGVLRMGLKIGNQGVDNLDFDIKFNDVTITGDNAMIEKYTALANELTGNMIEEVEETPEITEENPVQPSPKTGVTADIAAFTALGLSAAAIMIACKLRNK